MPDMFSMDWGGKPGACWECWKCEPCCGDPCNFKDGLVCCLCWLCPIVGCCSFMKLYAYSMDQECACLNHCCILMIPYVGGIIASVSLRTNLRAKWDVGYGPHECIGWVGDCLCQWICGPCVFCQSLRAVPKKAWRWWDPFCEGGLANDDCVCCVSESKVVKIEDSPHAKNMK